MAKASVTLRLGSEGDDRIIAALKKIGATGDQAFAGLSREAKAAAQSFDRVEKSLDAQARSAAQVASTYVKVNAAVAAGVRTQADAQRVLDLATERHRRLTGAVNDNAHAVGLARHELINVSRQIQDVGVSLAGGQSLFLVGLQQGSQLFDVLATSSSGLRGGLVELGRIGVRALFSPVGAAAGLAAAVFGVKAAGDAAAESLAKLGEESRQTALTPNRLTGAKIVGARAGLDDKDTVSAFANAQKEFEAYSRNSGAVKDILEKVDKGFLKVLDSARSSSEWIDKVNEKIRSLPTAQAQELAKALYTPESGRKLFEEIQNGAVSMASLSREAEKAGANFDVSATHAEKMRHDIAEIDRIASTRLLATFGDLVNPVLAMEKSWANMKLGILEVERSARQLRDILRVNAGEALGEQGEAARSVLARMRGLSTSPTAGPFAGSPTFYQDKARFFPQLESPTVGETRKLFESTNKARGGGKSSQDRFADVVADLKNRIALASSEGAAHDDISLKIKIGNKLRKLGTKATQEQKDEVSALVTQLDAAEAAQKRVKKAAEAYRDVMRDVGDVARDSLKGFLHDLHKGDSLSKSLRNTWATFETKSSDKVVENLVDSIFGKKGDKSSGGGIFENLFGGAGGGFFSKFFGGSGKGLFSGSPFHFSFPGFTDGGLVGAPMRHMFSAPLSAFAGAPHFANGGGIPAFLHAGEIVLNAAQQKNVAGQMAPSVSVNVIGAPAGTQQRETTDSRGNRRVDVVIDERFAAAMGSPQGVEAARTNFGMQRQVARR